MVDMIALTMMEKKMISYAIIIFIALLLIFLIFLFIKSLTSSVKGRNEAMPVPEIFKEEINNENHKEEKVVRNTGEIENAFDLTHVPKDVFKNI